MVIFKSFKSIIVSTALVAFLAGCAASPPRTSPGMAEPPASTSQKQEQEQQSQIASSKQTETDTSQPSKISSLSIFKRNQLSQVKRVPVSLVDMEFVQQRYTEYQMKRNQWLEISAIDQKSELSEELITRNIECLQLLERLLTGYSLLLDRMQQSETIPVDKITTVDPKKMQQLDIAFLESRCDEILTTGTSAQNELTAGKT